MTPEDIKQLQVSNRMETLHLLLEMQQNKHFTLDEVYEIGESLINFYELLADNSLSNFGSLNA